MSQQFLYMEIYLQHNLNLSKNALIRSFFAAWQMC